MSRIQNILIEHYGEHYARVNVSTNPASARPRDHKAMQLMHGDLVASLPPGSEVLDLGCGTGFLLYWLSKQPGIVPVGVDASPQQVESARTFLPDVEIICSDGLRYLRRNRGRFAGMFCTDVVEHIPGDDLRLEWLEACREALTPGGFFYCRVPNAANVTAAYGLYRDLTHDKIFTVTSLMQLLEAAGFRQCRVSPVRASHFTGRVRLAMEYLLHRILFQIVGNGQERIFTGNVCIVAYR